MKTLVERAERYLYEEHEEKYRFLNKLDISNKDELTDKDVEMNLISLKEDNVYTSIQIIDDTKRYDGLVKIWIKDKGNKFEVEIDIWNEEENREATQSEILEFFGYDSYESLEKDILDWFNNLVEGFKEKFRAIEQENEEEEADDTEDMERRSLERDWLSSSKE